MVCLRMYCIHVHISYKTGKHCEELENNNSIENVTENLRSI